MLFVFRLTCPAYYLLNLLEMVREMVPVAVRCLILLLRYGVAGRLVAARSGARTVSPTGQPLWWSAA